MKAARFHGRMDLRVEEVSKPVPKGDEVLIDVEWCGICGSDLHEYQYGLKYSFFGTKVQVIILTLIRTYRSSN